jgi:hypothetical protein
MTAFLFFIPPCFSETVKDTQQTLGDFKSFFLGEQNQVKHVRRYSQSSPEEMDEKLNF